VSGRGLPDGATLVYRTPLARCLLVVGAPLLLLLAYGRLLRLGLPSSRLYNPGTLTLAALAVVALALVFLPPGRRVNVAGGPGWVARRAFPLGDWRVVQLSSVRQYSVRRYATRGPRMISLRIVDADGRSWAVAAPEGQSWVMRLADAVDAQGGQQVGARPFDGVTGGRFVAIVACIILVSVLPLPYLEAGPLRVLPGSVAGWFTSGGCRAALAAESQQGSGAALSWRQTMQTGPATWHLVDQVPATVAQVADSSADPPARLAHLRADGATGGYQLTYLGPDGARVAVDAITFGNPTGAAHYLHYVNRATCERFSGTTGPTPGEVRWTSGRSYGIARWAADATVYSVSPVLESPEATRTEVDGLAAAAQATATG
jgi:hypothetical protein